MISENNVAGYEFSEDLKFCREAVWILEHVARNGAAVFTVDDGFHPEVAQLIAASRDGYFYFADIGRGSYAVIDREKFLVEVQATDE